MRRDLSPAASPLSFYALGAHGRLFTLALLALALAVAMLGDVSRWFYATAAALAVVGLVPTDPWLPWDRPPTAVGAVHDAAFFVLVASFGIGALLASRHALLVRGVASGLAGMFVAWLLVGTALMILGVKTGHPPGSLGLHERVLFAIAVLWLAVILLTRSPRHIR